MVGRVRRALDGAVALDEGGLIAYVMAGYPDPDSTISAVRGLVEGGADVIELGFPFSDPLADGATIQEAAAASLDGGTTPESYRSMVDRIRSFTDMPLIMMTYANVAYSAGYGTFVRGAVDSGIDGFILPDMPVDESDEYRREVLAAGADTVFLTSPNTSPARAASIIAASTGFLYLVSMYGTTGASIGVQEYAVRSLKRMKRISGDLPVGVGFGISRPEDVRRYVEAGADAVIVGSAFLRIMKDSGDIRADIRAFARSLKDETRA